MKKRIYLATDMRADLLEVPRRVLHGNSGVLVRTSMWIKKLHRQGRHEGANHHVAHGLDNQESEAGTAAGSSNVLRLPASGFPLPRRCRGVTGAATA